MAMVAPCSGVLVPEKWLRSVATYPGQAALIRMLVSANSFAYWMVTALRNVLDGAYAR